MEEDQRSEVFQSPPEYQSRLSRSGNNNSIKRYGVIIAAIIVLGLIIFGAIRFIGGNSNTASDLTPTPTIESFPTDIETPTPEQETPTPENKKPTETPTTTPKPTSNPIDKTSGLDRGKLSVHVLNGSGAAGASKKASDLLESLGYNVIQIGNAENFDYEKTEIQITSAQSKYLDLLKKDLSGEYTIGTTTGEPGDDIKADAVVIVGKE